MKVVEKVWESMISGGVDIDAMKFGFVLDRGMTCSIHSKTAP